MGNQPSSATNTSTIVCGLRRTLREPALVSSQMRHMLRAEYLIVKRFGSNDRGIAVMCRCCGDILIAWRTD